MATTTTRNITSARITVLNAKSAMNPVVKGIVSGPSTANATINLIHHKPNNLVDSTASFPRQNTEDVRVVPIEEYKEAALCLAEAFAEDEVARYFIDTPDRAHWTEKQKWDLHVQILEYVTYAHILKGLVTAVGPDYGAVALWMPPQQNMDDLVTVFRSGMWRLNYKLSPEGKKRFFTEFLPLLHDTKAATLGSRDDDSWYLVYLGTRPTARGKGYARKLIQHVTEIADREGRACYLESSNVANPAIYRKYGFEERRKIHLQRAEKNVELDIMVREPAAVSSEKA